MPISFYFFISSSGAIEIDKSLLNDRIRMQYVSRTHITGCCCCRKQNSGSITYCSYDTFTRRSQLGRFSFARNVTVECPLIDESNVWDNSEKQSRSREALFFLEYQHWTNFGMGVSKLQSKTYCRYV